MEQVVRVVSPLHRNQAVIVASVVVPNPGLVIVIHEVDVAARFRMGSCGLVVVANPLDPLLIDGRIRPAGQDDGGKIGVPIGERGVVGADPMASSVDGIEMDNSFTFCRMPVAIGCSDFCSNAAATRMISFSFNSF